MDYTPLNPRMFFANYVVLYCCVRVSALGLEKDERTFDGMF